MFILIKNKHILSTFEENRLAPAKYKKATEISVQKVKYDKTNPSVLAVPRGFNPSGHLYHWGFSPADQSTTTLRTTTGYNQFSRHVCKKKMLNIAKRTQVYSQVCGQFATVPHFLWSMSASY